MLTPEERERIRDEMEYRELLLRELHPPTTRLSRIWKECSHPAIITILGGLIIAGAGAWFQHRMAVQQQNIAHRRHMKDVKHAHLESFCKEFERDMTVLYGVRLKQLQLYSGVPDPLGRSQQEAAKAYVELYTYYYQNCHPQALLLKTTALFESQSVLEQAHHLTPIVRALVDLNPPQQKLSTNELKYFEDRAARLGADTHEGMYKLVSEMGNELRSPD